MRIKNTIRRLIWIVPMLICAGWVLTSVGAASDEGDDGPKFGPWSTPVNIGPPVDTADAGEFQPSVSADGLSLYFVRVGGTEDPATMIDIWVAHRPTTHDPWGDPEKLPDTINSPTFNDVTPSITVDGHHLYFASMRTGPDKNGVLPFGGNDIYLSRRQNKREDFGSGGWQEAINVGPGVNTSYGESAPFVFEDESTGITTMYFQSSRPGMGGVDIYASTLQPDETFGPAVRVAELSSPYNDQNPTISRDGLEMYFASDRPGSAIGPDGVRLPDIWVSTRASTSDPWGTPVNLDQVNVALGGPAINSQFRDARPSLSFDGTTLYFHADSRPGNQSDFFDIWKTTRAKLKLQE